MFRSVKHWVWLLLFWFVLAGQVGAMPCDVDNDGDIDLNDLTLIQKSILARAAVTGPSDPRDPDQNGLINSIDGRLCALRCTRAKCSTINQTPFANAGPDQTVKVGDPVQLSGAASSDPDGDPLRYSCGPSATVRSAASPACSTLSPSRRASPPTNPGSTSSSSSSATANSTAFPIPSSSAPRTAARSPTPAPTRASASAPSSCSTAAARPTSMAIR
jgi:hypothetical protein